MMSLPRTCTFAAAAVATGQQQQQQHATGEEVFWEVWNDIGLQDYMDTLQKDVQMAFTDAVDHGNFDTLWNLAKNRKGAFIVVF